MSMKGILEHREFAVEFRIPLNKNNEAADGPKNPLSPNRVMLHAEQFNRTFTFERNSSIRQFLIYVSNYAHVDTSNQYRQFE